MNLDPERCYVAVKIRRGFRTELLTAEFPTRTDDGVESVVGRLRSERGFELRQVTELYAEWSLSDSDRWFVTDELPYCRVTWSFRRPTTDEGWDKAIRDARIELTDQLKGLVLPRLREERPTTQYRFGRLYRRRKGQ